MFSSWSQRLAAKRRSQRNQQARQVRRGTTRRRFFEPLETRRVLSNVTFDADVSIVEGDSGTQAMVFTVRRDANDGPETVDFSLSDADGATATRGVDFQSVSGTLDFNGGQNLVDTIVVPISGDTTLERNEFFFVDLSNPTGGIVIGDDEAIGTITNDDTASIDTSDGTLVEGDAGQTAVAFTVTLSGNVDTAFTVGIETRQLSATGGVDYVNNFETLNFNGNDGEQRTFTVQVTGDTLVEGDETFSATLFNLQAGGRDIGLMSGTGTVTNDDTASVVASNVTLTEGDAGETAFEFTATLSGDVDTAFMIDIATGQVSATAGLDYVENSATLNFNGNDGEQQAFTVQVTGDTLVEENETFSADLSNLQASGRPITLTNGTGTITNDDVTLAVSDVTLNEGDAGQTAFEFTVTLQGNAASPFSVDIATAELPGGATAGVDFTANSATLDFAGNDGEQQTFTVQVAGENLVEADESFAVNLSNEPGNGNTIPFTNGTGTITNDDSASVAASDVTLVEGDAGETAFEFTITLSGEVDTAFTVDIASSDMDANAGVDYVANSATLNFNGSDGEQQTFTVQVTGDSLTEANETFSATLSNPQADGREIVLSSGTGTITNDDTASVTTSNVALVEGDSGETALEFTVTLSGDVDTAFTVDIATGDNDATAGVDYVTNSATLNFNGNDGDQQTFTVQVTGDTLVEADETFNATLSNLQAEGRAIDLTNGVGTITNDDASLTVSNVTLHEGDAGDTAFEFTVTLAGRAANPFTVDIATAELPGGATAGVDFTANSATLNFVGNNGEQQTFTVQVTGDTLAEADESFAVNLSNGPGNSSTILFNNGAGAITNDDTAMVFASDVTLVEGDAGDTAFDFTVTLRGEVDTAFTVDIATEQVSATDGVDYATNSATLNFNGNDGEQQTFTVQVAGDTLVEGDETFSAALSNLQADGRAIDLASGTGTITNDDFTMLSIMAAQASVMEGNEGTTPVTYTVTSSHAVQGGFSVALNADGADAEDFNLSANSVTFLGDTDEEEQTFNLNMVGELRVELDETVTITLGEVTSTSPGLDLTTVTTGASDSTTITNDDLATVSVGDVILSEGNGPGDTALIFAVSIDNTASHDITVVANTGTDAATSAATGGGTDFTDVVDETVTILAGSNSAMLTVNVTAESLVELDETFQVNLSDAQFNGTADATRAAASNDPGTGTITNDDSATLSIADVTQAEGDAEQTTFQFTLTLSNSVDVDVKVNASTSNGTAIAGQDYTALVNTPVTITTPGTNGTVTVQVTGETLFEAAETFNVALSGLAADGRDVTLGDATGLGTIQNDDVRVAGFAYLDADGNGQRDEGELGLPGVLVTLARTDVTGVTPTQEILTALDGSYMFTNQPAGSYSVTERQPLAMVDGAETVGGVGGDIRGVASANDLITQVVLAVGEDAQGYNFGELRTVTPVPMGWYLASAASRSLLFRERIASVEAATGNTDLAARIRAVEATTTASPVSANGQSEGESDSTVTPDAGPSVLAEGESTTNNAFVYDTNFDGVLSPADVLVVINELNGETRGDAQVFTDVNADGLTTPMDALMVLNALAEMKLFAEAEGGLQSRDTTPDVEVSSSAPLRAASIAAPLVAADVDEILRWATNWYDFVGPRRLRD